MADTTPKTTDERLESMLKAFMREHRSDKRKSFILRLLMWTYLIGSTIAFVIFLTTGKESPANEETAHIAKIDVIGQIKRKGGVAAYPTIEALAKAFESETAEAIILDMDSPGGSAAQSDLVYRELLRLRQDHPEKPVYAVVGDVCASGCYYIASAADEIVVNRTSMIGSIGVRMDGFDFTGLMEKVGVQRRILSAGKNKVLTDPFLDMDPEVKAHLEQNVLAETHKVFIEAVKKGRGDRLVADENVFTGLVWLGEKAIEKGLADSLGSVQTVIRDLGDDLEAVNYTNRPVRLLDWITGRAVEVVSTLASDAKQPQLEF
ncbi:S49 family peptidase [Marinobacter sp. F3R08]|uniref:S49 family peptidase n=1 Tax=Marinobacter sp. F3R08 TaxID=2841559 RepID=UPI001C09EF29|nr:S49 family peptidase [Marinobacter sp. F3R08]MBU2952227.1 S49 family peptidase [Marinobacter sp. F3R08]